jgi:hypothetical protein
VWVRACLFAAARVALWLHTQASGAALCRAQNAHNGYHACSASNSRALQPKPTVNGCCILIYVYTHICIIYMYDNSSRRTVKRLLHTYIYLYMYTYIYDNLPTTLFRRFGCSVAVAVAVEPHAATSARRCRAVPHADALAAAAAGAPPSLPEHP